MQPTTPRALNATFATAIRGIAPSDTHESAVRWNHRPELRELEIGDAALRDFYLVATPGAPSEEIIAPEAYAYRLDIVTSYAGVPSTEIDYIVDADARDLWDAFEALYSPTTPGLYSVEPIGSNEIDDPTGTPTYTHAFRVVYARTH